MTAFSSNDVTAEAHHLLTLVNNARKMGWPLPPDVATSVEPLVAAGLVGKDERGHFVVDEILWALHAAGRPVA